MVKPGYTASSNGTADRAQVHYAERVMADLAQGRPVAPEAITHAKETYVELLWSSRPTAEGSIAQNLVDLYTHAADARDRAELVGEIVAAGERAGPVLDKILRLEQPTELLQHEVEALRESVHVSAKERLGVVVRWVVEEAAQESAPASPARLPSQSYPGREVNISPSRHGSSSKGSETSEGGSRGPEAQLTDLTLSEESRLDAALELGPKAVPILMNLLHNPNPNHREFGITALNHLGRTNEAARLVHEAARRLESQPEQRLIGEWIRQNVEDTHTNTEEISRARERARSAAVPDGWLRRALDACDAPSILKAAAGREVLAIPMALRRLAEMRASQASQ